MRIIDADALVDKFAKSMPEYLSGTHAQREAIKLVNNTPTIEPVKRGECEFCSNDYFDDIVCYFPTNNGDATSVPVNFCPNCGTDMRFEQPESYQEK